VGIKELKDQASAIIQSVEKTGRPVLITRNNETVARIEPIATQDPLQALCDAGVLKRASRKVDWLTFELSGAPIDGSTALEAILADREEE
jgi:prevent-host-death family protein